MKQRRIVRGEKVAPGLVLTRDVGSLKKGRVLSFAAFQAWVRSAKTKNAAIQKYLPPYNPWYFPAPFRRAG